MSIRIIILVEFFSLCLASSSLPGRERDKITYHLERGSRIWINGSATLGSYECKTVAVFGIGNLDSSNAEGGFNSNAKSNVEDTRIAVQVRLFDCGNPIMNEDMYKALRADNDSLISFELIRAVVLYDSTEYHSSMGLRTIGKLTIAGITREDTIDTVIRILPGRKYEITGIKNLTMTDFKIIPPTAFFGLIKANEKLVVGFDLIAAPVPVGPD